MTQDISIYKLKLKAYHSLNKNLFYYLLLGGVSIFLFRYPVILALFVYLFLSHVIEDRSLCLVEVFINSLQILLVSIKDEKAVLLPFISLKKKVMWTSRNILLCSWRIPAFWIQIWWRWHCSIFAKWFFSLVVFINLFFHIDILPTSCPLSKYP